MFSELQVLWYKIAILLHFNHLILQRLAVFNILNAKHYDIKDYLIEFSSVWSASHLQLIILNKSVGLFFLKFSKLKFLCFHFNAAAIFEVSNKIR